MADMYSTQSPFIDKAADEADLERKNKIDLATINAVSKAMGSAAAGTPDPFSGGSSLGSAAASGAPTPQQMGVTAAPAAPASPFDSFSKLLSDTDPSLAALRAKSVAGATQQLDNPAAAFDQGAAISREDLGRTIQSARESQRDDLIKTYGANASQVMPQLQAFDQGAILQSRDLNRRLTADRGTAVNQGVSSAIANAMGILSQQSQEQLGKAGLTLSGAQTQEQSRQFEKGLSVQQAENELGRKFTTAERQAIQAYQTSERQGSEGFAAAEAALGRKFTTEERAAIQAYQTQERLGSQSFAAGENALGRAFTTGERQAIQDFQRAEREGAQGFEAAEAALGRKFSTSERQAIEAYQTSERTASQAYASAEAALGRTFSSTERQAVQDFQRAERMGAQDFAAAETALGRKFSSSEREAIQAYQTSERQASQVFTAAENDLGRKFTSSERAAVQDFQKAERLGAQDFASAEAVLGRKFTSEEREAIQTYQTSERLSSQDFAGIMAEKGYVHDNQLEIMRGNLQKELQATGITADQAKQQADQKFQELVQQRDQQFNAGQADLTRKWNSDERIETQEWQKGIQANEFMQQDSLAQLQALTQKAIAQGSWDNASKLQAEQLLASAAEAEKARSAQYLMFSAQQAQQDGQFAAEFGLKQEEVRANTENMKTQLAISLKQLGMTEDQWRLQKDDAAFNKSLELAQYGVAMWNGENEEALKPFVEKLATTLGQGMGLDPAILQQAIASKFKPTTSTTVGGTTTGKQAFEAFDATVDKTTAPEIAEQLKTVVKTMANATASVAPGTVVSLTGPGADYDAAIARLKSLGHTSFDNIVSRDRVGEFSQHYEYEGTPEFQNYTIYTKLLGSGMTVANAKTALAQVLNSQEKADAALALEARK